MYICKVDNSFRVDFGSPVPPLDISLFGSAEQCSILRAKPGWKGDWHPAPFRQLHFYLSGQIEVETSDGEIRRLGPGSIALVEDITGKGHQSHVIGIEYAVIAIVKMADSS